MIDRAHADRALARLRQVEAKLADAASSPERRSLRELVREHAALKRAAEHAQRWLRLEQETREHRDLIGAEDTDPELRALAKGEIAALESALAAAEQSLRVALLPPDENEGRNAILEIRAGTGGDEAALFAADLFRMYGRYAEGRGWTVGLIDASSSEIGGYKEVVFSVEGPGSYATLKYEGGGHRVQRVPVTEAAGRIHTSAATVAVFPEAEPEDDIQIAAADIRIDVFRASGPGGQSVNRTDSAVRITHLPTGIVVQCQDEKSQHRNKDKAMAVLRARILDMRQREEAARMGETRRSMIGSGDRSERIRTYNFPQNRLTDHRINLTLYTLDRILEGDLDALLAALRDHDVNLRLQEQLGRGAGAAQENARS
jgi:peptide chain release factor 1